MSLEDRFRHAFDSALAEVRTRLASELTSTLTDVRAEWDREKAAALAAVEESKAAELAAAAVAKSEALAAADAAKAEALAAADAGRAEALAAAEEAKLAAVADAKGSLESELLSTFQSEKDALATSHQTLLAELREAADGEAARLRADAEAAKAEAEATATRLRDEAAAEVAALRNDLEQAQAEALREREDLHAALAQAREQAAAEVAQARHEADAALAALRDEHGLALTAAGGALREEHEAALEAARTEAMEVAATHSRVVEAHVAGAIRLLESVRALDGASSLPEVLDALAYSAAKEAGRSAMLVVKGDRLVGWRTSGFGDLDQEPRSIEASAADLGALAAAVNTGRPAVVGSGSALAAPAFSQLPADRPGLAVPLLVAGRPVAVLYADTGEAGTISAGWTSPVEVLVRHAGRCLEAMAVARGAQAKAAGARVGTPA